MKALSIFALTALVAAPALAVPTVNGSRDAQYGSVLAVQTVETGFGDNASEMDAGYALIDSGRLYLMLTGNIEANFNKLEIFIDSKAGGQTIFDSSGNDNADRMDGLKFDAGFTADYHIIVRCGNDSGNDKFDLDFANLGRRPSAPTPTFSAAAGWKARAQRERASTPRPLKSVTITATSPASAAMPVRRQTRQRRRQSPPDSNSQSR